MENNQLTYDEFKTLCLQEVPENQHEQWLAQNTIETAPMLPEGWMVVPKSEPDLAGQNYKSLDNLQDYEHARETE
jgi:hypothetical protein